MLATWIALAIVPLVFTNWGWRLVLIPVGRVVVPLAWKALMALIWIGFAAALLMMPLTYRTFGFDLTDAFFLMSGPEQRAEHRRQREERINPEGSYDPGWRVRRGLRPLPSDWKGEVGHLLPAWSAIPLGAGLLFLAIAGRRKLRARAEGRAANRILGIRRRGQPVRLTYRGGTRVHR
jgi:hypothetical protein